MVKRKGCSSDQIEINDRCYDVKGKGNIIDLLRAANCYDALASMKDYLNSREDLGSSNFQTITKSVIKACLLPDNHFENSDIPFHSKSIDAVVKHSKREPHKGVLPSGHRGDFIQLRNCHGTMTFLSS
jgi:hypothetical protein